MFDGDGRSASAPSCHVCGVGQHPFQLIPVPELYAQGASGFLPALGEIVVAQDYRHTATVDGLACVDLLNWLVAQLLQELRREMLEIVAVHCVNA